MDETFTMDNQELDRKEPEQNQGGILRRLRDRDLLRKRKAETEEKETNQVESKRRRARGEQRSSDGKRGRPRKTENLPEVLPIQEEEKEEESVQQVPQPPAEESLPEAVKAGPAQIFYSPLLPSVYIPTVPAPLIDVASVEAPVVASSSTYLFPPTGTLTPTPTPTPAPTPTLAPAQAPTPTPAPTTALAPTPTPSPTLAPAQAPTPAQNVVPELTFPTPNTTPPPSTSTQSPPLSALSGQSQTEAVLEAPVSAQSPLALALALAPAPAPSALVCTTESSTRDSLGQVTIEDLGPDELEDVRSPQKEVAIQRFDTDSAEGPSLPIAEQSSMFPSPLLTSLPTTQGYFKKN